MANPEAGDLVRLAGAHPLDGIVFDVPSHNKVIVAVVDPTRGPVLRSVDPSTLTPREEAGGQDAILRALIRRTPPPTRSTGRGAASSGGGRSGFRRGAAHRATGR